MPPQFTVQCAFNLTIQQLGWRGFRDKNKKHNVEMQHTVKEKNINTKTETLYIY